jgi:4'-phosphopantetheinyl transferase
VTRAREVGVDVEWLRPVPDAEQIAARYFAPGENDLLRALPPGTRLQAFFNCWTRKEAYVKALGNGLAQALDAFEVSLVPGEPAGLIRVHGETHEAARWSIQALQPATGCVGAVAAEGSAWSLACWTWAAEPAGPVAGGARRENPWTSGEEK